MTDNHARYPYDVSLAATVPNLPWDRRTYYERWEERQGIPIHREFFVGDLRALETGWWDAVGANAAFVELDGAVDSNCAYVLRLEPGVTTQLRRRTYEEVFYVLEGSGSTTVTAGSQEASCQWQAGSLFTVPVAAGYAHTATEAATLYCVTAAPMVMNLFHNDDFLFDCQHDFLARSAVPLSEFFSPLGRLWQKPGGAPVWECNFARDVRTIDLPRVPIRGADGRILSFQLGENALVAHVSEFEVGTYKKAHRHGPGAHVLTLSGAGYSLLWETDAAERVRVDWADGAVLVPPRYWWHQHFNSGAVPARYLAIRWGSPKHRLDHSYDNLARDRRDKGDQIEYDDQDPIIEQLFQQASAAAGAAGRGG